MVFLAFFSISKRGDWCYGRFGTFWGPKNLFLMPKNTKKRIWIFCLFLRVEMTSRHKNSSKTLSNTPKMVQNYIKGVNIYIGRPSKKKNQKIWTQGKSCFFTVNATKCESDQLAGIRKCLFCLQEMICHLHSNNQSFFYHPWFLWEIILLKWM